MKKSTRDFKDALHVFWHHQSRVSRRETGNLCVYVFRVRNIWPEAQLKSIIFKCFRIFKCRALSYCTLTKPKCAGVFTKYVSRNRVGTSSKYFLPSVTRGKDRYTFRRREGLLRIIPVHEMLLLPTLLDSRPTFETNERGCCHLSIRLTYLSGRRSSLDTQAGRDNCSGNNGRGHEQRPKTSEQCAMGRGVVMG